MKVVYTATARRHIAILLGYLIEQGAAKPAARLRRRITAFITDVVARYPRAAPHIAEADGARVLVSAPPYVLQYRIDVINDVVVILALFHSAQDRRP